MKTRTPALRLFFLAYGLLWAIVTPIAVLYFRLRGRKDPLYAQHLSERFGAVPRPLQCAIWVHTVSLGEFRSATPLVRALLDRGDRVHVTCMTPTGRREAEAVLANDIAEDRAVVSWVPLDLGWACRRFMRRAQPKACLLMEMEFWPRLIEVADRLDVPVFFCNAQYPAKTFERDNRKTPFIGQAMGLAAGAMVKSDLQKRRFGARGVAPIAVTGELRFDQPVPDTLVAAGGKLRQAFGAEDRPIITIASAILGEDDLLIEAIHAILAKNPQTLIVYVPRAPERFDEVAGLLSGSGLSLLRRSEALAEDLSLRGSVPDGVQVLLGDSMGEMYAYLAMADRVIVGGGFVAKGAHNVSEAFAMRKPVWVGPHIWTIEYPAQEAIAASVLEVVPAEASAIATALCRPDAPTDEEVGAFFAAHSGALAKTLGALDRFLANPS